MASRPPCPVCSRPMTHYVDGWRCMNVKAADHTGTSAGSPGKRPGVTRSAGQPRPKGIHMAEDQCPYKIRWTFDTDTQCSKPAHVRNFTVAQLPDGRLSVGYDGDGDHEGPSGYTPGQVISWHAGDRREYTGDWPGPCTKTRGCTLHTEHFGRCAP